MLRKEYDNCYNSKQRGPAVLSLEDNRNIEMKQKSGKKTMMDEMSGDLSYENRE